MCAGALLAEQVSFSDAQIKAAYIIKINDFVIWPKEIKKTRVCLIGDGLVGNAVAFLIRKSNRSEKFSVIKKTITSSFDECRILFIDDSAQDLFSQAIYSSENKNILTISDVKNAAERGSVIGFVNKNERMLIEINLNSAKQQNLIISSKLLNIAERIVE